MDVLFNAAQSMIPGSVWKTYKNRAPVGRPGSLAMSTSLAGIRRASLFVLVMLTGCTSGPRTHLALNAEAELTRALQTAATEDKSVLVHIGGPGCPWCVKLDSFLVQHHALLDDYFICLKVDLEQPDGTKVARRLRGAPGGIPWMVILDSDGQPIVTSDGPRGNIGFPSDPEAINYFIEMLRIARPEMSSASADGIREALWAAASKLQSAR